jgi:hypothetical protein
MSHTKSKLWKELKDEIMKENIMGTKANQWSARKSQLLVKRYKEKGGKFYGKKTQRNSLVKWTTQQWTTRSGLPSHITGERYLPRKAIEALSPQEYGATTRLKRKTRRQYSAQPKSIARKTRRYRI